MPTMPFGHEGWASIILAIATLVSVIFTGWVNIKNARKTTHRAGQAATAAQTIADQARAVETKLDSIHALVNDRLSRALEEIDRLKAEVHALTEGRR